MPASKPVRTRKAPPAAAAALSISGDQYSLRSTVKLMAVNGQPIEIIKTGTFHHPVLGRFEVTEEMIDQMVENFPGPDILPMDYNHGSLSEDPDASLAAGWIQRLYKESKDDRISLMAEVAWTDKAKEHIEAGEFRFISAELAFNDLDVETGKAVGTNLLAAALTNRPFIPGMDPVSLKDRRTALLLFAQPARAKFQKGSLLDKLNAITSAFYKSFPDSQDCFKYVRDVLEDAVIISEETPQGGCIYKVSYAQDRKTGDLTFAPISEWVEMEQVYVPVGTDPEPMQATAANTGVAAKAQAHNATGPEYQKEKSMDKLRELLGLAPETPDADVIAAFSALKTQAEQVTLLSTQVQELNTALEQAKLEASTAEVIVTPDPTLAATQTQEVARLTERANAFEGQNQTLKAQIEKLEAAEKIRNGETLIANALAGGKVAPVEVNADTDGKRPVLGSMAFSDPATFAALVDARPAAFSQYLKQETPPDGSPASTGEAKDEEFWQLVAAKRTADPSLSQAKARAAVLADRPDLKDIFAN